MPTTTIPYTTPSVTNSAKYGGTVTDIENVAPGTPLGAPWEGTSAPSYISQQYILETLVREQIGGTMAPGLADSWDVNASADAPSITWHLHQGVKFSDGSDFNAQAVAWNMQMFQKGGLMGATTDYWKSFDVIDNYTLRVNLKEYRNTLVRAMDSYFMVSPAAYDKNGISWLRTHMVGTGAFIQSDYQRDVGLKMVRNPNYWATGKPYLDAVNITYVADELTRMALFKSGGGQAVNVTTKQVAQFANQGFTTLSQKVGPMFLAPDSLNTDSPWANIQVRQAAEYALDREALATAFGFGFGQAAYQMPSTSAMGYDSSLTPRKYDVAKAKQLLTDAGYPSGFKTTIWVAPGSNMDPVVAIQAYFRAVGINAEIQAPEAAQWQTMFQGTWKNGLLYSQMAEWANYNTTLNYYFGVPNGMMFRSLKKPNNWADLFNASIRSPAPDPTLIKAAVDAAYNDAMVIPVFYSATAYVVTSQLQDSGVGTRGNIGEWNPWNMWLSK